MYRLNELSVVISGAGQGIQAVEQLLSGTVKDSSLYVFATKEYVSRVRGGKQLHLAENFMHSRVRQHRSH